MKLTFYHGTTDLFKVGKVLLPPDSTGNKREDWRKKYTDKVFMTTSLLSAEMYAKKASRTYGGNPIVYIVRPLGQYFNTINTEYIADRALVLGIYTE